MMQACVVVPIYKTELHADELASLQQLDKLLPNESKFFIAPMGLKTDFYLENFPNYYWQWFEAKYFKNPQTYNQLLRKQVFFKSFQAYTHLLMYHTDAWVFNNQLKTWLTAGYSYIGAPMYAYNGTLSGGAYLGVGQGGFSLHHIPSALKVLGSWQVVIPFATLWQWYSRYNWRGKLRLLPKFIWSAFGFNRLTHNGFNQWYSNEDVWWGVHVPSAIQWYKVPPLDVARLFSIEFNCDALLAANQGRLPFGTHQWYKPMFREFWKRYTI